LERLLAISKESINASGDHLPTNQQGDVYDIQRKKLDNAKKSYQDAVKIIE
jgi:hypothetical protein